MQVEVAIYFQRLHVENLAPVAAGCSRDVVMHQSAEWQGMLSLAPSGQRIQSRNAIVFFLLDIDPLAQEQCTDLIWYERNVKPVLSQLYRSTISGAPDVHQESLVRKSLEELNSKIGGSLEKSIKPLEIILWADLYMIFMDQSRYRVCLPKRLQEWFGGINKLEPLQKAVQLVLGDEFDDLTIAIENLTYFHKCEPSVICSTTTAIKKQFLDGFADVKPLKLCQRPKIPIKDARNILVTSALPYVNNEPHLGNLIGSTLSADVFSRYCRCRGINCLYICGTDEYGTTTEIKAIEEKCTPREICDRYFKIHYDVYKWFNIDFDIFGRTSTDKHKKIVSEIFMDIFEQGFTLEDTVTQLLCESCGIFLADRLVEGTCPLCSYDDARGDQCDKCGKLINAVELKNPKCKLCRHPPVIKDSKHIFLDLTKMQEKLEVYLKETMESPDCIWSNNAISITKAWLHEGLKPRSITRDLKWGVAVPLKDFENKVFYVWFDAVLGYLSITACYTPDWKKWWVKDESIGHVELYQFMAKDNVPFHSVMLPANLMATGKEWNIVKQLASTEYLNYENDKFSKSRGLGVFGSNARDSGIEADVWRFYLVSCRPETQDTNFMWDEFATRNNSELVNNFGNFVHRTLSFLANFYGGVLPDFRDHLNEEDLQFIGAINQQIEIYVHNMNHIKMKDALYTVLNISHLGNGYFQKNKAWENVKSEDNKKRADVTISVSVNLVVQLGVLISPIMPTIADKMFQQCNAPANSKRILDDCCFRAFLQPSHQIGTVSHLFQRMEESFVNEMKKKYSTN